MKIVSWNVNGLRKLKPLEQVFNQLDADILCFQETRISGRFDPELESLAFVKGYHSFFSVCKQRRGYSGVATFCKKGVLTPLDAGEGLASKVGGAQITPKDNGILGDCSVKNCLCEHGGCTKESLELIQEEGRCVITDHKRFVLINVYVPAVSVEGRVSFKMQFLHALQAKIDALRNNKRHVIVVGDYNICPSVNDMAEPMPPSLLESWEARPSRQWLLKLLAPEGCNFVDTFRALHPNARKAYTCWSEATRARENNFGVRIDLIVMDNELFKLDVTGAEVHADVQGSDHCPVSVTMKEVEGGYSGPCKPPKFCTLYMPRFAVRQSTLKDMFSVKAKSVDQKSTSTASLPLSKGETKNGEVMRNKSLKKRKKEQTLSSTLPSKENEVRKKRRETAAAWRKLLSGPPPPPLCKHGKQCVLKAVTKTGENKGRTFFSCPFPAGIGKEADCGFFKWAPFKAGQQPYA